MAANTVPDNIPYPETTDQITPLTVPFAALAQGVQNALNTRALKSYRWDNASARTTQSGMAEGDTGVQLDSDVSYTYTNGSWVATLGVYESAVVGTSIRNTTPQVVTSLNLPAGTYVVTFDGYFDFSTVGNQTYVAEIYNSTGASTVRRIEALAGTTGKIPFSIRRRITLTAASTTIQARGNVGAASGTQLITAGMLSAERAAVA